MKRDRKRPFAIVLVGIFALSAVLTYGRILIMGWFVYFGLHFYAQVGSEGVYMYWLMFPLSIFGLWRLLEVATNSIVKLTGEKKHTVGTEA